MKPLLICFFTFILFETYAHTIDKIDKQVLIQFTTEYNSPIKIKDLFPEARLTRITQTLPIWRLEFSDTIPNDYIKSLRNKGAIINYVKNRRLSSRATIPDDSLFNKQFFHLNNFNSGQSVTYGINSICAWDNRKDITTLRGDTIVVAVFDFGFDTFHEDLDYFINFKEIPYDGIDNDSNGAIDDYRGWNIRDNNHIIKGPENYHGMPVCGGIAAIGNNKKGVTGVAWNTKLLPLNIAADNNGLSLELSIKAIDYCITMRRLYRQTNKQKGAYIVALNHSLGTDGFLPSDEPLWCSMFDSLGSEGILSTCAVKNVVQDVESYQDMPILCNSPYQINVTAYGAATLAVEEAYSRKYVHLAAPHNYWSTYINNSYNLMGSGSSFATPLVAGTIALMYSNFDTLLLDTLHKNPKLVSLKIKETILKQVDVTDNLMNKVVSNGKLNVCKTIAHTKTLQDSFYTRSGGSSISASHINSIQVYSYNKNLVIKKSISNPLDITLYNLLGQPIEELKISDFNSIIDLSHLYDGIYFATYRVNDNFYSEKIILR